MRRIAITSALLMALSITGSAAQQRDLNSANYHLPGCKGFIDPRSTSSLGTEIGFCVGAVEAIAFMVTGKLAIKGNWRCANIPAGVTIGQLVRVVVQYIEAQPQRMHQSFNLLALEALVATWPCDN
jgi:hypothetical protein